MALTIRKLEKLFNANTSVYTVVLIYMKSSPSIPYTNKEIIPGFFVSSTFNPNAFFNLKLTLSLWRSSSVGSELKAEGAGKTSNECLFFYVETTVLTFFVCDVDEGSFFIGGSE